MDYFKDNFKNSHNLKLNFKISSQNLLYIESLEYIINFTKLQSVPKKAHHKEALLYPKNLCIQQMCSPTHTIANLSYNFNYNIVESWDWNYSPILQPTTHPTTQPPTQPPNRKSSDNCDISAVTDPILIKI